MNILGFNITEHSDLAEPYKTFVRQMSKWYLHEDHDRVITDIK